MTEDLEDEKKDLNKNKPEINRGFELLLRNRRKKPKPKTFEVKFSFFDREIAFSLDIKKRNTLEKQSWK
tara:strand:+ start:818 stop:1024 length:207 start_codon:yes stop_codon:yes gene_type:complete